MLLLHKITENVIRCVEDSKGKVRIEREYTEYTLDITTGVKQGDGLSSLYLLNSALEKALKTICVMEGSLIKLC